MCEKRSRKIKKGSQITRLREARRLQRLQWIASPTPIRIESNPPPLAPIAHHHCPNPPQVDKVVQNRVILELAWKTFALMQKNKLIQQKIIELQKETSEFVASVMIKNKETCEDYRRQGWTQAQIEAQIAAQVKPKCLQNITIKIEPTDV